MDFYNNKNITIFSHPLIKHKISLLRDRESSTNKFRQLVEEIAMLEAYEALKDLPLKDVEVETPLETCMTPMIDGLKLAIIPVLRAGLGMVPGIEALVPSARIGHIGMYRDEKTHKPVTYFCKLPQNIDKRISIIVDPMLATGGSAVDAVSMLKEKGAVKIKFVCILAAPEGLEKLATEHPDVQIYVGQLDRCLNKDAYICPGLGDAGDRIFGTK
ncbi:MAG: uracil phosphoribosyltransferase [Succinivibrio sp.]|nr:uracil phosphoribosyltransferase [Succinivibrio sp.]MBQ8477958.1 uracil phosphoribosyltransferase [Succinivibrio sp.]MCI5577822.1 uracil phosphoribosyltransferase [Succinivibrio sp.]MCI5638586.1 uracil phosphoribosyltransferase [Succinivibrio sp.]MCI6449261.1 uracil phosphoribosyltransferase [Succinivibrio sp.]